MTRSYLSPKRLAELEQSLGTRDWMILATLSRLRLASGQHLHRLYFHDLTRRRCQQALAALVKRGILVRLPRAVGGVHAGSFGHVYTLDTAGWRLVARDQDRSVRPWNVGLPFLAHTLGISELHVRLVEAERAGLLELRTFVTEPACWRWFSGVGGGRAVLKPDAYVITRLGNYEDAWFIEWDRGTEASTTLTRKCDTYRAYWQTGREQERTGVFPRVLWVVPNERRHAKLVGVFGRQPAEAWVLFAVTTAADVVNTIVRGTES